MLWGNYSGGHIANTAEADSVERVLWCTGTTPRWTGCTTPRKRLVPRRLPDFSLRRADFWHAKVCPTAMPKLARYFPSTRCEYFQRSDVDLFRQELD